jgi:hypothetical protein
MAFVFSGPSTTATLWCVQVRLREPSTFQLEDIKAVSFAEVAERARALQARHPTLESAVVYCLYLESAVAYCLYLQSAVAYCLYYD